MRRVLLAVCLALMLLGCVPARSSATLTVFAAASLTEAFTEIGRSFETANPGVAVAFNFAGSQQLVQQLSQGAPADVFASAHAREIGRAVDAGVVVSGTARVFAVNRLIVILPRGNPAGIRALQDLARPGVRLDLADPMVPAGEYAQQVLEHLSADPAFGAAFRERVNANLVSREENVKAVVAKVRLGEADAGIVYATDVAPAVRDQLETLAIPDPFNVVATYPIAATVRPPAGDAWAEAFVAYVLSAPAQEILARYGFGPARGTSGREHETACSRAHALTYRGSR